MSDAFQFIFDPDVSLAEAEQTLHLGMFAVEGLTGRARVRLEANYHVNEHGHAILIECGGRVGRMIARVFAGLLLRECGEDAFQVERCTHSFVHTRQPAEVQA